MSDQPDFTILDFQVNTMEKGKFLKDTSNEIAVRTKGELTPTGLTTGGLITAVSLTTSWAALPSTALTNRNTLSIQNQSDNGGTIIINYTNSGSNGWRIYDGGYKEIPITDDIIIYGRMITGTGTALVDEIA